jgi:hypothetical protein
MNYSTLRMVVWHHRTAEVVEPHPYTPSCRSYIQYMHRVGKAIVWIESNMIFQLNVPCAIVYDRHKLVRCSDNSDYRGHDTRLGLALCLRFRRRLEEEARKPLT